MKAISTFFIFLFTCMCFSAKAVHSSNDTIKEEVSICKGEFHRGKFKTGTYLINDKSGNVIELDLTVFPSYDEFTHVSIYEGESFLLSDGRKVYDEGVYLLMNNTMQGCDSMTTIKISFIEDNLPKEVVSAKSNKFREPTETELSELDRTMIPKPVINVYPIPSDGIIYFEMPQHEHQLSEIEILDFTGKVIKTIENPQNTGAIELYDLYAGHYLFMCRYSTGKGFDKEVEYYRIILR